MIASKIQNNIISFTSDSESTGVVINVYKLTAFNTYLNIISETVDFQVNETKYYHLQSDGVYKVDINGDIKYLTNIYNIDSIKESYILKALPCNQDICRKHFIDYNYLSYIYNNWHFILLIR